MSDTIAWLIAIFSEEVQAQYGLKKLQALQKEKLILIYKSAVIKKIQDGNISVKNREGVRVVKGLIFGAIAGGLIGILGGFIGLAIGAAAGAAAGGISAHDYDIGLPGFLLDEFVDRLSDCSAAIVIQIPAKWNDQVIEILQPGEVEIYLDSFDRNLMKK